jgi:hypothetical protein
MQILLLLIAQVVLPELPPALSLEPTLAVACQCQSGGECLCGDDCRCEKPVKESKPVISVVNLRIDDQSPITIAPDPDNDISTHPDLFAFIERHKDGQPKVWKGPKLPPEVTEKPRITSQEAEVAIKLGVISQNSPKVKQGSGYSSQGLISKPAAVAPLKQPSPPVRSAQPPARNLPPIERAAMVRVYVGTVCVNGRCEARYEYRPVAQQPTKSVQRYQPRRARWR